MGLSAKKKKRKEGEEEHCNPEIGVKQQSQDGKREASVLWAGARFVAAVVFAILAFLYTQKDDVRIWDALTRTPHAPPPSHASPNDDVSFFSRDSIVDALSAQDQGQTTRNRLWGTYRSGQYLGIRAALPQSPLFGLMWLHNRGSDAGPQLRHDADARDGLNKYGWLRHDGKAYGKQQLIDGPLEVRANMVLYVMQ